MPISRLRSGQGTTSGSLSLRQVLEFEVWEFSGAWCLGFGVSFSYLSPRAHPELSRHPSSVSEQGLRLGQSLIQFAGILAAAPGVVRPAPAFAAHNGRNLLDDFARLHLGGKLGRHGRDEGDGVVRVAAEDNNALESALERVGDRLEKFAVRI